MPQNAQTWSEEMYGMISDNQVLYFFFVDESGQEKPLLDDHGLQLHISKDLGLESYNLRYSQIHFQYRHLRLSEKIMRRPFWSSPEIG